MPHVWDIKLLQQFRLVYEHGSLSIAAEQIGLTQSAMTKNIKKLEEQLGIALFHRHTRELQATTAAKGFYPLAAELIAAHRDFSSHVEQLVTGQVGQVNIGCGPLVQQLFAERIVEHCIHHHPDIQIRITAGDFKQLSSGLLNHDYDFLLYDAGDIAQVHAPERFQVTRLLKQDIMFVASPQHPCVTDNANPLTFKWALPHIPAGLASQIPNALRGYFSQSGIPQYELDHLQQCINLAKKGLVITAVPYSEISHDLKSEELVSLKTPITPKSDIALYRLRSRNLSKPAQQVVSTIREISHQLKGC